MTNRLFIIIAISLFGVTANTQPPSEGERFRSPVDFNMYLSGTFGELRDGHFHAGIDIKTYEQTGKAVKMIAAGYVSRIKISATGYGKAIYVTHPNGYTSVFAHLKDFNRTIKRYVQSVQKAKERYEIDISVPKDKLYYKKGNIIGYSGNSGYSFGPHIHFEIRETASQMPVNPLQFYFDVEDDIPPTLRYLKLYDDSGEKAYKLTSNDRGKYNLTGSDTLDVWGSVSFGLEAIDKLTGAPNPNGPYAFKVSMNDSLLFWWSADRFSFYETRYINAFIDYAEYIDSRRKFMQTRQLPNNRLSMYRKTLHDGLYPLDSGEVAKWRMEVSDFHGNVSVLSFYTLNHESFEQSINKKADVDRDSVCFEISPNEAREIDIPGLSLRFSDKSFYNTASFAVKQKIIDTLKVAFQVGDKHIPLHRRFIMIADSLPFAKSLQKKLYWGIYDEKDKKFDPVKTTFKNGKLIASTRNFGIYTIKPDTVAPNIKWPGLEEPFLKGDTLKLEIKDNFSDIKTYDLYINNEWVIAEYDKKDDLLFYIFDRKLSPGELTIKCQLEDYAGNKTTSERKLPAR